MQLFLLTVLLGAILTILVSGNNLSVSVGTVVGARIIRRWTGVLIGIVGYVSGLLLEGESLRYAATALLPHSYYFISIALLISITAFIIATLLRAPLSLTMVLVGSVIGISIHAGRIPDQGLLLLIVAMWIISPILSIAISYLSNKVLIKNPPQGHMEDGKLHEGIACGCILLHVIHPRSKHTWIHSESTGRRFSCLDSYGGRDSHRLRIPEQGSDQEGRRGNVQHAIFQCNNLPIDRIGEIIHIATMSSNRP